MAWVLSNVSFLDLDFERDSDFSVDRKGCLLALILGGGDPTSTFAENNTFTRTKAYMTFILAFVAVTSIVVSFSTLALSRPSGLIY